MSNRQKILMIQKGSLRLSRHHPWRPIVRAGLNPQHLLYGKRKDLYPNMVVGVEVKPPPQLLTG